MRPFLENPQAENWAGPDEALTALYKWARHYDPAKQSYALRSKDWRYIRYANGKEELYHTAKDPYEWHNLADKPEQATRIKNFRRRLKERLPLPVTKPASPADSKNDAEAWKDTYFKKHPEADINQDGQLSWRELKTYRAKTGDQK